MNVSGKIAKHVESGRAFDNASVRPGAELWLFVAATGNVSVKLTVSKRPGSQRISGTVTEVSVWGNTEWEKISQLFVPNKTFFIIVGEELRISCPDPVVKNPPKVKNSSSRPVKKSWEPARPGRNGSWENNRRG